jgi:hypothetical protein
MGVLFSISGSFVRAEGRRLPHALQLPFQRRVLGNFRANVPLYAFPALFSISA